MATKEKLSIINGLEVWVVNDPSMVKWQGAAYAYGLKTPGATSWAELSGYVFDSHEKAKAKAEQAARVFSNWKKMGAGKMNIGKLVRQRMKELSADLSGDYVDSNGRHYELTASADGYTCSYSNGAKSMELDKSTASKLAGASKKLGTAELSDGDTKRLAGEQNVKQVKYQGFTGKSYYDPETKHWYCEFEGKTPSGKPYSNVVTGSSEADVQKKFPQDVADLK